MFKIELTDGEMYEIGDAIAPALQSLIVSGDPEHYEAKYGSASNMLSVLRKIWEARSPGNPPDWIAEFESKVAALREKKSKSRTAADAVEKYKKSEAQLKSSLGFTSDADADADGIRSFDLQTQAPKKR